MKLSRKHSTLGRIETPEHVSDGVLKAVIGGVSESLSLNYGHIEWAYTQQKRPDGAGGGNVTAKYDLVKAKGA